MSLLPKTHQNKLPCFGPLFSRAFTLPSANSITRASHSFTTAAAWTGASLESRTGAKPLRRTDLRDSVSITRAVASKRWRLNAMMRSGGTLMVRLR